LIKATESFHERMLSGLLALKEKKIFKRTILVSRDPIMRMSNGIEVMPYTTFSDQLWNYKIV